MSKKSEKDAEFQFEIGQKVESGGEAGEIVKRTSHKDWEPSYVIRQTKETHTEEFECSESTIQALN